MSESGGDAGPSRMLYSAGSSITQRGSAAPLSRSSPVKSSTPDQASISYHRFSSPAYHCSETPHDRQAHRSASAVTKGSRHSSGIPASRSRSVAPHRYSSPNITRFISSSPGPSNWQSQKRRSSSVLSLSSYASTDNRFDLSSEQKRAAARRFLEEQRVAAEASRLQEEKRLKDEKYRRERREFIERCRLEMDQIIGKWERYAIENDGEDEDEIVLGRTDAEMIIIRNRGKIEGMVPREIGGESDGDDDEEEVVDDAGTDVGNDPDDDPLSGWGVAGSSTEDEEEEDDDARTPYEHLRTREDDDDLALFLKAEAGRRAAAGERSRSSSPEEANDHAEGQYADVSEAFDSEEEEAMEEEEEEAHLSDLFPELESEDELLAQTSDAEDATRTVTLEDSSDSSDSSRPTSPSLSPPPSPVVRSRRTRSHIEIVLPARLRTELPSLKHGSSPARTASSLHDLFTPPRDLRDGRASSSTLRLPRPSPAEPTPAVPAPKGKSRMPGERPFSESPITEPAHPAETDPRYLSTLMRSRNGVTLRICKPCTVAGGERAEKARWCRGRGSSRYCLFDKVPWDIERESQPLELSPEQLSPASRLISRTPNHADERTEVPSFTPKSSLDSGKNIHAARPLGLDARYATNLHYTYGGQSIRHCQVCVRAGGVRKNNSAWCFGRWSGKRCVFVSSGVDGDTDADADYDDLESISSESGLDEPVSRNGEGPIRTSLVISDPDPSGLDSERYASEPRLVPGTNTPRLCKHCRIAGGERSKRASLCFGRDWAKRCLFWREEQPEAAVENPAKSSTTPSTPTTPAKVSRYRSKSSRRFEPSTEDPYYPTLRYARKGIEGQTLVSCKACKAAGGSRGEKAKWCKGRRHPGLCAFSLRPVELGRDTPSNERGSADGLRHARYGSPARVGPADEIACSTTSERMITRKRKRLIVTETPETGVAAEPIASPPSNDVTTYRTPLSSKDAGDDRPRSGSTNDDPTADLVITDHAQRSLSPVPLRPRTPPLALGPPVGSPTAWSFRFWRQDGPAKRTSPAPFRPTPSPSLSIGVPAKGNSPPSLPPSSPCRPIMPLPIRANPIAFGVRPTPPPSELGDLRSRSLSLDHVLHSLPLKSALRQPSESSSVPRNHKRLRFSLVPRSPPRVPSPDPLLPEDGGAEKDESDDELLLSRSTRSPSSSLPCSSPPQVASSSPFSMEISLRAQDVGYTLGPQHTGRLSSHMLAALVPALGASQPTLGSLVMPLSDSDVTTIPPLSIRPTSSRSDASPGPRGASVGASHTAGLMLPPPVPAHRQSSARQQSPVSNRETSPTVIWKAPVSAFGHVPEDNAAIAGSGKPRARSRSMSLQPNPGRLTTPVSKRRELPATTARKKSRAERDLAKVAKQVDDEAGLEWGMDDEVGGNVGRLWREGSVVTYLDDR